MLPRTIYEALPHFLALLGAIAALILYNRIAIVSGVGLVFLALIIVHMRLHARTRRVQELELQLARIRSPRPQLRN